MNKHLLRGFGVGWLVFAAAACMGTEGTDPAGGTDLGDDIQAALRALPQAEVNDVDENGVPTFISGDLGQIDARQGIAAGAPDLRGAVAQISRVFRANPDELVLKQIYTDDQGDQHLRYAQQKNGLEILGAELIVHLRDGVIMAANGAARADLPAPVNQTVAGGDGIAVTAAELSSPRLHGKASGNPRLAYRVNGTKLDLVYVVKVLGSKDDGTPVDDDVIVNAGDGSVVGRMPHIHTAKTREVHNANHGKTLPGATVRTEGGAAAADAVVNDNYDRLGKVYDAYKALFNRDSFDNAGAKLISSVHYDKSYNNAFWDGTQMVYGDGDGKLFSNLARSLDVTGHELTHAVTERTSNLVYDGESGGLNEALSDILGNTVEWWADGKPNPAKPENFLVGEDIWTPQTAGDALRYMCNPALDGESLDFYTPAAGSVDVHMSSGIANLAFCLLAQGGKHPQGKSTINVTGIGFEKAARVFYKADTAIFTSKTTFAQAKTYTEQAAKQLGLTSAEVASVTAAWKAVGVGLPPGGPLHNGVAVTVKGAKDSQYFFSLAVPAGAKNLTFVTSGGTGDVDLYVKFGSKPTTTSYDCRPFKTGNAETCNITTAKAGTYYVMLKGKAAYSGASLVGSFFGDCAHDKCASGAALTECDPCVGQVCAQDPYCCSDTWDAQCEGEVSSVCHQTCK